MPFPIVDALPLPWSHAELPWFDAAALLIFVLLWLFYEPLLRRVSRARGAINRDMDVVRTGWMARAMSRRDTRLLDANLMGHALNSASFFASANLILIAAVGGALFSGDATSRGVASISLLAPSPTWLIQAKLGLVLVALVRGLLDFIWGIRQMNYWLAAMGAAPGEEVGIDDAIRSRWAEGLAALLNPALSNFSAGVRAYYFALAAAAWLLGPLPFAATAILATMLLVWRQSLSKASDAIRRVRALIEHPENLL